MDSNEPDTVQDEEIDDSSVDSLAGEELFEVPEDLDDSGTEAPASTEAADPKEGPPADKDTATQQSVEDKETPATPTDQPPARDPAGRFTATPETPDGEEPVMEFSFRADGKPVTIPGSRVTAEGAFIPREHLADLQRLASHGIVYQGSFRKRLEESAREVAEAKSEVQSEVEQAKHFLGFFANLLDRQEQGEPAIEEWLDDFRQNRTKLEAEATLAEAKALRESRGVAPRALEGFDETAPEEDSYISEREAEEFSNGLASELGSRIQQTITAQGIRGLTPQDLTRLQEEMNEPEERDKYFKVALEDIPEHGIVKGQIVAMDGAIAATLKRRADMLLDARKTSTALSQAEAANRRNGVNGKVPPTVATGAPAVPKASNAVPKFKNRQEMEEWFQKEDPLS